MNRIDRAHFCWCWWIKLITPSFVDCLLSNTSQNHITQSLHALATTIYGCALHQDQICVCGMPAIQTGWRLGLLLHLHQVHTFHDSLHRCRPLLHSFEIERLQVQPTPQDNCSPVSPQHCLHPTWRIHHSQWEYCGWPSKSQMHTGYSVDCVS